MDPLGQRHVPNVARVERELAELWRQAATDEQPVMRACELNLVVACGDGPEDALEATRMIDGISETTPCRAIVISPRAHGDDPGLEIYASAHCHRISNGARVCSEQITIETRGPCGDLVPGAVRQLLVGDLGVWTWWRRPRLKMDDLFAGLLGLSDRFLVDSATSIRLAVCCASCTNFPVRGWPVTLTGPGWTLGERRWRRSSTFDRCSPTWPS